MWNSSNSRYFTELPEIEDSKDMKLIDKKVLQKYGKDSYMVGTTIIYQQIKEIFSILFAFDRRGN